MKVKAARFTMVGVLALVVATTMVAYAASQQLINKRTTHAMITTLKLLNVQGSPQAIAHRLRPQTQNSVRPSQEAHPPFRSRLSLAESKQQVARITNAMVLYRQLTVHSSTALATSSAQPSQSLSAWATGVQNSLEQPVSNAAQD